MKSGEYHFVEVKTSQIRVSRETNDEYSAEGRVPSSKILSISRAASIYMEEVGYSGDWRIDLVCVYIDESKKKATIRMYESIS